MSPSALSALADVHGARLRWAPAAVGCLLAHSAIAADPSIAVLTDGRGGTSRLLLDPGTSMAAPTPAEFRVVVGNGGGRVATVTPFGTQPVYTALAFDASGSFAPNLPVAVQIARDFVRQLPSDSSHRTAVVMFGSQLQVLGEASNAGDADALVATVANIQPERLTRLKALIKDTVDIAAQKQPASSGGLRQVVVFTDAGEESSVYTMKDVIDEARKKGVRVSVVEFAGRAAASASGGTAQKRTATGLDETKDLAEATGGVHVSGDGDSSTTAATLGDLARSSGRLVWLDIAYCGVSSASPFVNDKLAVELVNTGGSSTPQVDFSQEASGAAVVACSTAAFAASAQPPANTTAVATPSVGAPSSGFPWWIVTLLAAAAAVVAAVGGAVVVVRWIGRSVGGRDAKRSPPVAKPEDESAQTTQENEDNEVKVLPPPTGGGGIGEDLPMTLLRVRKRPLGRKLEEVYMVNQREVVFGGSEGEGVDRVLDVGQVSGRHAKFELYPNGNLFVTDLGSSNGTFINDVRIPAQSRLQLKPGDVVKLSQQLEFVVSQPSIEEKMGIPESYAPATPAPVTPAPTTTKASKTTYGPVSEGFNPPGSPPAPPANTPPPPRQKSKTMYAPVKPPGEES